MTRKLTKRSFLLQVVGAGACGTALSTVTGASATPRIPGYSGRFEYRYRVEESPEYQQQQQQQQGRQATGVTDRDPTDQRGNGRGTSGASGRASGFTDSDPSDQRGAGRGTGARGPTGYTDRDSSPGDPANYGRGPR